MNHGVLARKMIGSGVREVVVSQRMVTKIGSSSGLGLILRLPAFSKRLPLGWHLVLTVKLYREGKQLVHCRSSMRHESQLTSLLLIMTNSSHHDCTEGGTWFSKDCTVAYFTHISPQLGNAVRATLNMQG